MRAPDDGVNTAVYLVAAWVKHQGPPDEVIFAPRRVKIERGEGRATTNVTFTAPGEYVLRARVDNFSANDSAHSVDDLKFFSVICCPASAPDILARPVR